MKTSCFKHYAGPGRISIARYAPRGTPAGYRQFKAMAPYKHMLKMSIGPYRSIYFGEILKKLDPQKTWDHLHELAGNAEPVLLCWETLQTPDDWCHRRMAADWFAHHLGVEVPELIVERSGGTANSHTQQIRLDL